MFVIDVGAHQKYHSDRVCLSYQICQCLQIILSPKGNKDSNASNQETPPHKINTEEI